MDIYKTKIAILKIAQDQDANRDLTVDQLIDSATKIEKFILGEVSLKQQPDGTDGKD